MLHEIAGEKKTQQTFGLGEATYSAGCHCSCCLFKKQCDPLKIKARLEDITSVRYWKHLASQQNKLLNSRHQWNHAPILSFTTKSCSSLSPSICVKEQIFTHRYSISGDHLRSLYGDDSNYQRCEFVSLSLGSTWRPHITPSLVSHSCLLPFCMPGFIPFDSV